MPYFEGDFWPNVLEESIKELETEEEERRKAIQEEECMDADDIDDDGIEASDVS